MFMNPFEVREVLQVKYVTTDENYICLNPFEVREVLQDKQQNYLPKSTQSQSL